MMYSVLKLPAESAEPVVGVSARFRGHAKTASITQHPDQTASNAGDVTLRSP